MSPAPASFLEHLRSFGYHSRSNRHSNALAEAIANDLVAHCPKIQSKAGSGALVFDVNFSLTAGTADWNVDLVLGQPPLGALAPPISTPIRRLRPSTVEIAIELKSIMTEHHKAVKNRKRDLEAHHGHVHDYSDVAIAGGVFVINASREFRSPLRDKITLHRDPKGLVKHCIDELRAVAVRGGRTGFGLEAKCAIVVDHDNVDHRKTTFVVAAPAPAVGDPLHYDAFIQAICAHYTERFP